MDVLPWGSLPVSVCGDVRVAPPCPTTLCVGGESCLEAGASLALEVKTPLPFNERGNLLALLSTHLQV